LAFLRAHIQVPLVGLAARTMLSYTFRKFYQTIRPYIFLVVMLIYHELELENVGVTFECITTK